MGVHSARRDAVTLNAALERFFAQYYLRHPVNATFTGVHEYDRLLPDWSIAARALEATELRALRLELEAAHPEAEATPAALRADSSALDAALARANLDVRLAEHASGFFHDRNPALWTGEAIFGAVSLMIRPVASVGERCSALRDRLAAVPAFLGAMRLVGNQAVPARWVERAQRECRAAVQLFGPGLELWLRESRAQGHADVRAAATSARAAFASCDAWLSTLPAADDCACSAGESLFAALLQRGHFCTETPAQLLSRATRELAGEQERLREMLARVAGSWSDLSAMLAADHPSADGYLSTFHAKWEACRAHVVEHELVTWPGTPDWPLRYAPIPPWACEAAPQLYWLFYRSPAPLDPYSVHDYLVSPVDASLEPAEQERRLRAWNHSTITLNHIVHHGAIGHHVQNWHARHRSRSRTGAIAATDCASRIGMFLGGSMAEGWACYATDLMDETGFLTPLEQVAQQHSRVRMLARAIVDIRLHTASFTVGEAAAFYHAEVAMAPEVAAAETTKNSMFPCTAVMYWLGTSTIHALREQVRAQRGGAFRLRAFHDELLGWGAIPVQLAAQMMTA